MSVLFGVVCLLALLRLIFSSTQKKLGNHILKNFDKEKIVGATTRANFFGEQSKGVKQIRGNGALVLTKDKICYIRAIPFKEYMIPIKSITGISIPNYFNGNQCSLNCYVFNTKLILDQMQ
jgi:hypothetical protein